MTAYVLQSPPHAGATLTTTAPAATNNTAPCGNGVGLYLINPTGGTSCTITMHVPAVITFDGLVIPNRTLAIASPGYGVLPLVAADYLDPATGLCLFDVSGTLTNVLCFVAAIGT
jgi:hypothetical protein